MRWGTFALVAVATGMVVATAYAGPDFEQADRNKDGKIDRQEYVLRETDVFFMLDVDKNGRLTITEIKGVDAARFKAADRNGDGVLSEDEFLTARTKDFDDADKNHDGVLTPDEVDGAK